MADAGAARRGQAEEDSLRDEPLSERLKQPDAFLSRTDLRDLGLPRRGVDAVFRHCPIVALPGYSRPLVRVADYLAFIEAHTYRDDRVRP